MPYEGKASTRRTRMVFSGLIWVVLVPLLVMLWFSMGWLVLIGVAGAVVDSGLRPKGRLGPWRRFPSRRLVGQAPIKNLTRPASSYPTICAAERLAGNPLAAAWSLSQSSLE